MCKTWLSRASIALALLLPAAAVRAEPDPPELRNRDRIIALLLASQAGKLIEQGMTASAELHVQLDEHGRVTGHTLLRRSGSSILDATLARLTRSMVFTPATEAGRPIASSATIPFVFGDSAPAAAGARPVARAGGRTGG
jgi:TonB family protein